MKRTRDPSPVESLMSNAHRFLVITGAGISKESGIPTFRDADGWWKTYRPEQLATQEAFRRDPVEVWRWYDMRRRGIADAEPNPAHRALSRAEAAGRDVVIVTQNVVWWDEELDPLVTSRVDALVEESFDVVLVVGTEAVFDYIRYWALAAKAHGARLVELNPRATALTPAVDLRIDGKAGEVLDGILPD